MADLAAFDLLFQQADVDKDGKISGSEAIHFFKGSNLPQPILAKIWHAADNGHTGFLSRPEFYNALKLVTVAQSGRELTPEIMRAALVGPASAKIPAPKIQVPGAQPAPKQAGQPMQTPEQTTSSVQQQAPVQQNLQQAPAPVSQFQHAATFSQPQPTVTTSSNTQPVQPQPPQSPLSNLQALYQSSGQQMPNQSAPRPMQRGSVQGQMFSSVPMRPPVQNQGFMPGPPQNTMGTAVPVSSTGAIRTSFSSGAETGMKPGESPFGSDTFSAGSTTSSVPVSRVAASTPRQPVPSPAPSPVRSPMGGGQGFRPPVGVPAWPKMTASDVQRYSQVFLNVDTDKDGKITGTQARDLFFSWRLPREVLKQVWDLSDQDGDSMLSFREFCTSVYLIERFREGRPLPPVLPVGFHFDDGSSERNAQAGMGPPAGYNIPPWQRNPRMFQPGMPGMAGGFPSQQQNMTRTARSRKMDNEIATPASPTENKVLDSKEKLEFHRTKLQELVLFKRKCDNRLAEITDKAAAEKREEELMAKKYEEKYKQALDVNSRLVSEESSFREIETLKAELRNAIAEIERGGNPNTLLQTRADRISNDLDELEKALAQRGQFLGFQVNRTTVELPFGWQPGLQENAAEWDEDWDKFDDEGFSTVDGIMDEPHASNTSTIPGWDDGSLFADDTFDSNGTQVNHAEEHEEALNSPRAESETSSLKSGIDSPQWSPNAHSAKKSPLGTSPLSTSEQRPEDTPASSASFDPDPSFDGEKPWGNTFENEDIWGLQSDFPPLSIQSPKPGSDIGSSFNSEFKNENDIFASSSVPSTPLFKTEPQTTFFTQDSRRDSFESSHGRTSSLFDENDPFGDTGPFSQKSSRWGTF